jgi:hypothetical protein
MQGPPLELQLDRGCGLLRGVPRPHAPLAERRVRAAAATRRTAAAAARGGGVM